MVVRNIIRDKPPQMTLVRRNHVVQQLTSATSNPPFGHAILPGAAECCLQRSDPHASNCRRHLESVFRIVVQDEVIRIGNIRECFAQLLRDPDAGRLGGDVEVQDAPAVVRNDEKAIEDVKCACRNGEEINGCDDFSVVAQKCQPALTWIWFPGTPAHPAGDRSFRHIKTSIKSSP